VYFRVLYQLPCTRYVPVLVMLHVPLPCTGSRYSLSSLVTGITLLGPGTGPFTWYLVPGTRYQLLLLPGTVRVVPVTSYRVPSTTRYQSTSTGTCTGTGTVPGTWYWVLVPIPVPGITTGIGIRLKNCTRPPRLVV
jgi:hypothetical protein